jgi:hypothetical protein
MADSDVTVARRAYARAMECGAKPHIAFDVARAAFRARHPGLSGKALDDAVWLALGSRQDFADRDPFNVELFRKHAEELRIVAEGMPDVHARKSLMRLAADMELLAGRSEARGEARSSLICASVG